MALADILVVEDKTITAMEIKQTLEKHDYDVLGTVNNGSEAVKRALEDEPDLILMDIRLNGEMDGIEAAERIQEERDVPIVYMTAHSDFQTTDAVKETGPAGYISKPVNEEELYAVLEIALFRSRQSSGDGAGARP